MYTTILYIIFNQPLTYAKHIQTSFLVISPLKIQHNNFYALLDTKNN